MKIGLVGLGKMGSAIATRLTEVGFAPVVWDVNQATLAAHTVKGLRGASSPADVAAQSDIIVSIISEDSGVRALFHGTKGFLSTDISGKLFVEMTTLQPMTARELASAVEAQGGHIVDAPVLGTIPSVRDGKLFALVGGRPESFDKAQPLLSLLTRKSLHMGGSGTGCAMKLAVNLVMANYLQSLSEALSLGTKHGLEISTILDVLAEAPTANAWLAMKTEILKGAPGDVTLDIRTMRKDIMSAVATGAVSGVAMPVSAGALSALSAAVAGGWGDQDLAELPRFFREHMLQSYPQSES